MKNKQILFLAAIVLWGGMFFLNSGKVLAATSANIGTIQGLWGSNGLTEFSARLGSDTKVIVSGPVSTSVNSDRIAQAFAIVQSVVGVNGVHYPYEGTDTASPSTGVLANTDNCPGGCQNSCATAGLAVSTNQAEYCSNSSQQCCVGFGSSGTSSSTSSTGVLANTDNCPGGCRVSCATAGLNASTNPTESCSDSSQQCCAGFGSGSTTSGTPAAATPSPVTPSGSAVSGITCPEKMQPLNGVCFPTETGLSEKPVKDILVAVLGWLLGIFGALGVLTFIVSGVLYLTAAGDAEQEKKAKNAMKMGILGIIVGLSGFVIIQAIDSALNASRSF